jgi:hypothetical protein
MAKEAFQVAPGGFALLATGRDSLPAIEVGAEGIVLVGDLAEALIAGEREERVEVVGGRRLGEWRRTAGASGEVLELLKKGRNLGRFLAGLVRDPGRGEQPTHSEPLRCGRRRILL